MAGPTDTALAQQLATNVQLGNRLVGRDVLTGIRDASLKTGVDFAYMLAKANQESGLRPDAVNHRGTASGLFQFTSQTWLDTLQRHGPKHGLGDVAAQIETNTRGRLWISDPDVEDRVLALRQNPRLSAIMAAEYAAENKAYLQHALGRPAGTTDIYLAHFLGPGGAVTFLTAAAQTPHRPAAEVLPEAAASNPGLFWHAGRPRSLDELHRLLHATINDAMRRFAGVESLTQGPPPPPPGTKPVPPQPEDMGATRLAEAAPPPTSPGRKPTPPGYEDMGAIRAADAGPPIAPGAKPAPPPPEDMGATRLAEAGPPVPPGPRPHPPGAVAPAAPLPAEAPPPAPAPDVRIAQSGAIPAVRPADAAEAERAIARVLTATRAVEDASAARGVTLPGASAVAVAALLDSLPLDATVAPDAVAVAHRATAAPDSAPEPGPSASSPSPAPADVDPAASYTLPTLDANAGTAFLALARAARGAFEPDAAPWPTAGAPPATATPTTGDHPPPVAPGPASSLHPMAPADGPTDMAQAPTPDPNPASATPTGRQHPATHAAQAGLRAAPVQYLTGADATRAITAILGRHRSS
ncbi:transglycosylase SLT domain-containing protein [Roseospira marina]|uniref:Transglycosylase SLT domain-containing protein n=1 Tax=Roseospira marina TaxID=140057 RepID=A0A5M6I8M3_9PROT|nr:transglycosylase SLT domain-containing protein [Roseospira marina]KAA5604610.1 transglycosylase SLT domain-containing protein [Roseospira marina]MBB4315362.1 hypothetical protein [Roseospira marina]MBB5088361.1 hypothetical protein [Roseospira marina]